MYHESPMLLTPQESIMLLKTTIWYILFLFREKSPWFRKIRSLSKLTPCLDCLKTINTTSSTLSKDNYLQSPKRNSNKGSKIHARRCVCISMVMIKKKNQCLWNYKENLSNLNQGPQEKIQVSNYIQPSTIFSVSLMSQWTICFLENHAPAQQTSWLPARREKFTGTTMMFFAITKIDMFIKFYR